MFFYLSSICLYVNIDGIEEISSNFDASQAKDGQYHIEENMSHLEVQLSISRKGRVSSSPPRLFYTSHKYRSMLYSTFYAAYLLARSVSCYSKLPTMYTVLHQPHPFCLYAFVVCQLIDCSRSSASPIRLRPSILNYPAN